MARDKWPESGSLAAACGRLESDLENVRSRLRRYASGLRQLVRWLRTVGGRLFSEPIDDALTVAVDVSPFWENLTGVGWYLYQLLDHLKDEEGLRIRLYGPTMFVDPGDPPPVARIPVGRAIEHLYFEVPDDLLLSRGRIVPILRRLEPWLIAAVGDRLLFAPNFVLPETFRRARGRLVMTIHDRAMRRFPWTLEQETLDSLNDHLERNVRRAAAVITVSRTVRQELIDEGEVEAERVTAIHHGPGHLTAVADGRLPSGFPPRFALHVGTIEPRKNLDTLVEVWRRLIEAMPGAPIMVLCGGSGWRSDELRRQLAEAEKEGWVRELGYVDDASLAELYRRATLLVCPSLYEGFGLPVIEGLAAGLPVICSDIPVFREVAGEAAVFVPPTDVDAWLAQVRQLLSDDEGRRRLSDLARARAAEFDWRRAASQTLAVWRAAASRDSVFRGSR